MFQLIIGSNSYSSNQDFEETPNNLPEFAKEAFNFCHDWLQGKDSFILQTSGSTGIPKSIHVNRSQMIASATGTQSYFGVQENTNMLCCMNTSYIAGKMMLVRAMVWNCPILIIEPSSNPLTNLPDSFAVEFVAMVPLQVEESLKSALSKLKKVKYLIIGGAPISNQLKATLIKIEIKAFQTYGMTETVSHIAIAPITEGDLIYEGLPGVQLGLDARGALWINSEMSNNEKIQTNDLVDLVSENKFKWLGRADFVINSGGIKLHPEILESRIEPILKSYFPENSFFLFGEKDEILGERLILLIEVEEISEKSLGGIQLSLKNTLGKYECPKAIYPIREFIRTETGKINRQKTAELKS